ncbi:MAG TPA: di-heme oxidoredictase family protein [Candidatus Kapabacteria bacterium]|nr:di-heme oxidoredictase family protein [Candidatus Kapabacteria bacterium]
MTRNATGLSFGLIPILALALGACSSTSEPSTPDDLRLSGGTATIMDASSDAFSQPAPNLTADHLAFHKDGDAAFEAFFVSSGPVQWGLGPVYNNTSCRGCHVADGRGTPPEPGEQLASMLFRVSIPSSEPNSAPNPVPGFGGQLQQRSIAGVAPEGSVQISYAERPGQFADGTPYSLRVPTYVITNTYIPLPPNVMLSPRVAPVVFGLGLLEAVPESTILSFADENDANGDGISGRPNYVTDVIKGGRSLGRFGHKANTPSLLQQSAGAYNQDMGITSYLFPEESCYGQPQVAKSTGKVEVDSVTLNAAAFYCQTLGVPARRNVNDPTVLQGEQVFKDAKCASCHIPSMRTSSHPIAELSNQLIHPYTDLLIHDMGQDLADGRPDFYASGSEWRTAPLWGIGLTALASGHTNFLHDGRARNLIEAIMWHGGEAQQSREYVRQLDKSKRDALVKFLESL